MNVAGEERGGHLAEHRPGQISRLTRRGIEIAESPPTARCVLAGHGDRASDHLRDVREVQSEYVMQDDGQSLFGAEFVQYDQKGHPYRLVGDQDVERVPLVAGVAAPAPAVRAASAAADGAAGRGDQRFGQPRSDVGLSPNPRRTQMVQRQPPHYPGQPGPRVQHLVGVLGPTRPRLGNQVLRVGPAPGQPVGDAEQVTPLVREDLGRALCLHRDHLPLRRTSAQAGPREGASRTEWTRQPASL